MTDRTAAGCAVHARNLGMDHAEAERTLTEHVGADFTREVFEAAGGLGWQSTALTDHDRSIAIIAALVRRNVTDQRLSTYLSLARRNGVNQQGLTALMVLLTSAPAAPWTPRPCAQDEQFALGSVAYTPEPRFSRPPAQSPPGPGIDWRATVPARVGPGARMSRAAACRKIREYGIVAPAGI
jgi:4-carboxymuconolactone decarboxylase